MIGYLPVLGEAVDSKVWSDMDDFHSYEVAYPETVESRVNRLPMLALSERVGVKSYVVVPTTVCMKHILVEWFFTKAYRWARYRHVRHHDFSDP